MLKNKKKKKNNSFSQVYNGINNKNSLLIFNKKKTLANNYNSIKTKQILIISFTFFRFIQQLVNNLKATVTPVVVVEVEVKVHVIWLI